MSTRCAVGMTLPDVPRCVRCSRAGAHEVSGRLGGGLGPPPYTALGRVFPDDAWPVRTGIAGWRAKLSGNVVAVPRRRQRAVNAMHRAGTLHGWVFVFLFLRRSMSFDWLAVPATHGELVTALW